MADTRDHRLPAGVSATMTRAYRLACAIVRVWAPLVPGSQRGEWRAEWESELWHQVADGNRDLGNARASLDLVWRASGALPHALWLLRNEWRLDMIVQDVTWALRTSLKRPAFTALVVGMLALGIGANTAMFTVVNSVLLQPLPYDHADALVAMNGSFSRNNEAAISAPDFLDYRAGNHVFSSFSGYQRDEAVLAGGDAPERVSSWRVTADFFRTLGVSPLRGRAFLPAEEAGPGHDVAVLSYGLWQRRFGGDEHVVGTTANLNGRPTEIVGVMPPLLDQTLQVDIWRPFEFHGQFSSTRRFHGMRGVARLNPGVTLAQAQAAMDVIARQLQATYPENATWTLRLRPYHELIVGGAERSLMILLGAVGLVLLIACGNVASLLLARATSRQAEIGIRAALGASRRRLIRQLLTESLVLAGAGGAIGFALAVALVRGIRIVGSGLVPRLAEVSISPTVLAFTIVLALGTGLVFGLAPALHTVRTDVAATFAALGRSSGGRGGVRVRDALVVAQVALSLVLLVGAGLLVRSLWELQHVPPGFDADHVLTAQLGLPAQRYQDRESQVRFWNSILGAVRALPGVSAASATTMLPMRGGGDTYYWRADKPPATSAERRTAMISVVDDDYFATMHIAMASGRVFGAPERNGGPNAIVLNKRLADQLFGGEDPIGKSLVVDFGTPFTGEVIGVVGDVRSFGPASGPTPTLYFSVAQPGGFEADYFNLVARTKGNPTAITGAVRTALAALDRDIPLIRPQLMQTVVSDATADTQLSAQLLGGFAIVALVLAVVGLYGVLAYAVAQRTRELGIRIAFGARQGQLFSMVVRRGMTIVTAGIGLGVVAAFGATRLMSTMLFQVRQSDPMVLGFVTVTLAVAGLVACIVPARRATRVDPIVALRGD
jgi:putative ABC transport system permease protein